MVKKKKYVCQCRRCYSPWVAGVGYDLATKQQQKVGPPVGLACAVGCLLTSESVGPGALFSLD